MKTKPDLQPAIDELLSGMECATIWRHEEPRHRSRSEVRRLVSGYVHAIRILRAAEVCK